MGTPQAWWTDGKFGLFIHWGLYALLAGEYQGRRTENIAEWIMHDLDIPKDEYRQLASRFHGKAFNADLLVQLAKQAGMRYIVFTSKHHEGFSLFDSDFSSYTSAKTASHRDFVRELKDACDRHDLMFGLYYSQAQDWDDSDACRDGFGPEGKDFERYFQNKCLPQITELLTKYGKIGLLWLDTPMYMTQEQSERIKKLVKRLQPDCLISGRIGNGLGDYMTTGDNFIPSLPYPGPFEVPATINSTWGYNAFDSQWKTPKQLLRSLVKIVSRGGNYLLNIGPRGDGSIPEESIRVLESIGSFMRKNGQSIYETRALPLYPYDIEWGFFTAKKGRLFIHIFEEMDRAYLLNIANKPLRCYRLSDGLELTLKERTTCEGDSSWLINLPPRQKGEIDQVVCVEIAEDFVVFEPIKG
ncbi:alpha-L-fucosidase [Sphaerochaeta sp.]|uniref:alpha-L-fucosidase n=1 Tax=Sphaerochaeta sp. TaxID=1972642 RepID=UPI002FC6BDD4